MRALGRWWGGATIHPYVVDGAVAALLYVGLLIGSERGDHPSGPTPLTPLGVVLTGVVFGTLVMRRRWPLAVLAFTTVGVLVLIGVNGPKQPSRSPSAWPRTRWAPASIAPPPCGPARPARPSSEPARCSSRRTPGPSRRPSW